MHSPALAPTVVRRSMSQLDGGDTRAAAAGGDRLHHADKAAWRVYEEERPRI